MTKAELYDNWKSFGASEHDKSLYIEYIKVCNFISDENFYFYLNPDEATDKQFMEILDFLYTQKCFMLMYRFLRDNKSRLIYPDFINIEETEINEKIEERFKRYYF